MSWSARVLLSFIVAGTVQALDISLPTANNALLQPGREADFFQPTADGGVESGMFGCVRSEGRRFHEGIDIRCLQRDKRGEPVDPVYAVSDGTVAFINTKPGLSNYGRYIVLEHRWDGVPVFTLYAHLREAADALAVGQGVKKGQRIGTMGRSINSRPGISKDHAHLHFEISFMLNANFHIWYPRRDPKAPPFGNFNGRNFVGLDPAGLFRTIAANPKLNFAQYVAKQPVAFTVLLPARPFSWWTLHPEQFQIGPGQQDRKFSVLEIGMTAWGLPVASWPRNQIAEPHRQLLLVGQPVMSQVNEVELSRGNCRRLVRRVGGAWVLTQEGREWVELLTYTP